MGTATNELEKMKNTEKSAWEGFKGHLWKSEINTRDFIQANYTPYERLIRKQDFFVIVSKALISKVFQDK